jgi:hypothetical protein
MIFVQFQQVSILLGNRYQYVCYNMQIMSEIGLAEYFGMGEAVGIIVTLFVILYFFRKQIQSLSVDIETKILSDLDERIHEIIHIGIERPELIRVISKLESDASPEIALIPMRKK